MALSVKEIGSTKRKKVRIVDFGNALADILKKARKQKLNGWRELLGHSDVSATMNVYAHATRAAKQDSTTFPCSLPIRAKTREVDTYIEVGIM